MLWLQSQKQSCQASPASAKRPRTHTSRTRDKSATGRELFPEQVLKYSGLTFVGTMELQGRLPKFLRKVFSGNAAVRRRIAAFGVVGTKRCTRSTTCREIATAYD